MKFLAISLLFLICVNFVEPGWFDSLTSTSDVAEDMFSKVYSEAKHHLTDMQKQTHDEEAEREKSLPKFEAGSLGSIASTILGSAKRATETAISGVRYTATELTRKLIATGANTAVDVLLTEYKILSGATGMGSKLALPDIQTSAYGCDLKATGGFFSSISSLEKCGQIEVTIENADTATLEIPVRFNEMHVGYDHFEVSAFYWIKTSGSFSINIGKNTLSIKLRLGMDSTCALSLEKVTIKELDDITVKFEGLGSYASMFSEKLSNLLISYLKEEISRHIQEAVDNNLRNALDQNSLICSSIVPVQ